eukprot:COSAG06_NODE_62001_length_266_cov_0.616766_1_plen_40_part_10
MLLLRFQTRGAIGAALVSVSRQQAPAVCSFDGVRSEARRQ